MPPPAPPERHHVRPAPARIRLATADDADAILAVYAPFVDTPVTFEEETPSAEAFRERVAGVLAGEGTPDEVVKKHGFQVVSDDGALEKAVDEALAANPDIVEKLKSGNMKPMGAIIGAVMRATRGQADAKAVTKIVMGKIK